MSSNEELACRIQAGETDLLTDLWTGVEKFVSWKANHVIAAAFTAGIRIGVETDDLINAGYFAVLSAVKTYNMDKGSFIHWLSFYLQTEFAGATGLRTEAQKSAPLRYAVSLDAPVNDENGNGNTIGDLIEDPAAQLLFENVEDAVYRDQLHRTLEQAIDGIPVAQAAVIRSRYWEQKSLEEIGNEIGISGERVRQLEDAALRTLRKPPHRDIIERFIDDDTPFYLQVSPTAFQHSHTSATEQIVLIRERMRERLQRSVNYEKRSKPSSAMVTACARSED